MKSLTALRKSVLFAGAVILVQSAFGWGSGHDIVAKETLRVLPGAWGERLRGGPEGKLFLLSSHAPDDQRTSLVERPEYLDAELCAALDERNGKPAKLYGLHFAAARCEMIRAMARAMKCGNLKGLAYLLACFNHSVADTVSANHFPLCCLVTSNWTSLGLSDSLELDCCVLEKTGQSLSIMRAATDALRISLEDDSPDAIFKACYDDDLNGMNYYRYELDLVQGGVPAHKVLAKEAAYAVRRTAEALLAAESFARLPAVPAFDVVTAEKRAQEATHCFLAQRSIRDDALTRGLVPERNEVPELGVIYDPTGSWTRGIVYTANRSFAAQICTTLKKRHSAGLLDIREIMTKGVPVGVKTIVFPASGFFDYRGFRTSDVTSALADFMKKGGRLVWLGGKQAPDSTLFPEGVRFVKSTVPKPWGHMRCPVAAVEMPGCALALPGGGSFVCRRAPRGSGGWYWDHFSFNEMPPRELPAGARAALLFVTRTGERTVVGYTVGNRTFLPAFALFPYVFTDEKPQVRPLKLELDAAGEAILESVIKKGDGV